VKQIRRTESTLQARCVPAYTFPKSGMYGSWGSFFGTSPNHLQYLDPQYVQGLGIAATWPPAYTFPRIFLTFPPLPPVNPTSPSFAGRVIRIEVSATPAAVGFSRSSALGQS